MSKHAESYLLRLGGQVPAFSLAASRWVRFSKSAHYPLPDLLFFGFREELGSVRAVRLEEFPEDLEERVGQMFNDLSKSDRNPFRIAMMEIRTTGQDEKTRRSSVRTSYQESHEVRHYGAREGAKAVQHSDRREAAGRNTLLLESR